MLEPFGCLDSARRSGGRGWLQDESKGEAEIEEEANKAARVREKFQNEREFKKQETADTGE
jgi:hypothetical protein